MPTAEFDAYLTIPNWQHVATGTIYRIVGFATREADQALLVLYRRNVSPDPIEPLWVRPASEFFDGRFIRLFPGYAQRLVEAAPSIDEKDAPDAA